METVPVEEANPKSSSGIRRAGVRVIVRVLVLGLSIDVELHEIAVLGWVIFRLQRDYHQIAVPTMLITSTSKS
jgi:hypothetical protein